MVQLAMDGIGRGTPSYDHAESYMRDHFDDSVAGCGGNAQCAAGLNVKSYVYGLFSFTKGMLLHAPGGVLTPITLLHTTSGSGKPDIDWYAAEAANGDSSDGVARTLVNRQAPTGFWSGHSFVSNHYPFETAWSIIMLRRAVFVACVADLQGRGTPEERGPARVDLTWSVIGSAASYAVLRGTSAGGPYVNLGTTPDNFFSDTSGLSNSNTYFYVLQPLNGLGGEICQSNEATISVPAGR
jgi:hypothetical protein